MNYDTDAQLMTLSKPRNNNTMTRGWYNNVK